MASPPLPKSSESPFPQYQGLAGEMSFAERGFLFLLSPLIAVGYYTVVSVLKLVDSE